MKYDIYYKGTLVIEQMDGFDEHMAIARAWYSSSIGVSIDDITATPSEEGN